MFTEKTVILKKTCEFFAFTCKIYGIYVISTKNNIFFINIFSKQSINKNIIAAEKKINAQRIKFKELEAQHKKSRNKDILISEVFSDYIQL